jgi:hypothetical protein
MSCMFCRAERGDLECLINWLIEITVSHNHRVNRFVFHYVIYILLIIHLLSVRKNLPHTNANRLIQFRGRASFSYEKC